MQRAALDKGTPLRWLAGVAPLPEDAAHVSLHGALQFKNAVAMGDSPHSNDGPLGQFAEQGMPFVSVSKDRATVPAHLQALHVGGEEGGTAVFLQQLLDLMDATPDKALAELAPLAAAAAVKSMGGEPVS